MAADHTHDKRGFACNHVVRKKRPAMLVARGDDGSWQFMCGKDDHTRAKNAKKVCILCAIEDYAPGLDMDDIPPGHIAERKTKTTWDVRELTDQERSDIQD